MVRSLIVLVPLLAAVACAPVRLPHAVRAPILDSQGDLSVQGAATFQSVQFDAAFAVTDHFAPRFTYQTRFLKGKAYHLPTAGAGLFTSNGSLRASMFLDVGAGYAFNRDEVTTTSNGVDSTTVTTFAGPMAQVGTSFHVGADQGYMEEGLELQFTYHMLSHNGRSDANGLAHSVDFMPALYYRYGGENLKVGVFGGLDLNLTRRGELGTPFPLVLGANLIYRHKMGPLFQKR